MRVVLLLVFAVLGSCLGPEEAPDPGPDPDAALAADVESLGLEGAPTADETEGSDAPAVAQAVPEAPEPAPEETLSPFVQAQKEACLARGGTFGPSVRGGSLLRCFTRPKDANQRCETGADCEGVCLARSRTCAPVVPLTGCHTVILDSGIPVEQCLR